MIPEAIGMVEQILKLAQTIHGQVQKFKNCPAQIKKTADIITCLTVTIQQVRKNARLNEEILCKILKPVQSVIQYTSNALKDSPTLPRAGDEI